MKSQIHALRSVSRYVCECTEHTKRFLRVHDVKFGEKNWSQLPPPLISRLWLGDTIREGSVFLRKNLFRGTCASHAKDFHIFSNFFSHPPPLFLSSVLSSFSSLSNLSPRRRRKLATNRQHPTKNKLSRLQQQQQL